MFSNNNQRRNQSTSFRFYTLMFLVAGAVFTAQVTEAQDIVNSQAPSNTAVAKVERSSYVRKAALPVRVKAVKAKVYTPAPKPAVVQTSVAQNKTPRVETRVKNDGITKTLVTPVSTDNSAPIAAAKNYPTTPVTGTVLLKNSNKGAAGVLVEAIRTDTKEMVSSTQTDSDGNFRFSGLPTGVSVVFLVSSPNTQAMIMQTSIKGDMKSLYFSLLAKQ